MIAHERQGHAGEDDPQVACARQPRAELRVLRTDEIGPEEEDIGIVHVVRQRGRARRRGRSRLKRRWRLLPRGRSLGRHRGAAWTSERKERARGRVTIDARDDDDHSESAAELNEHSRKQLWRGLQRAEVRWRGAGIADGSRRSGSFGADRLGDGRAALRRTIRTGSQQGRVASERKSAHCSSDVASLATSGLLLSACPERGRRSGPADASSAMADADDFATSNARPSRSDALP